MVHSIYLLLLGKQVRDNQRDAASACSFVPYHDL